MRRALLILLLPTLSLASLCCQGTFKERQTNDTCPPPASGATSTGVECPGLCCSTRSSGATAIVFAGCTTNASTWIQGVSAMNAVTKALGLDSTYAEDCLLSSSAPTMRPSAAALITLPIILAIIPFV